MASVSVAPSTSRCYLLLLLCCTALLSLSPFLTPLSLSVSAYTPPCPTYAALVEQNCYIQLSAGQSFSSANPANAFTSRYDCALALGYYLPCAVRSANASYQSLYSSLAATPCLVGRPPVALANHSSSVTVVEVDSNGAAGLLSLYRHDNSTLNGNVGSCAGSLNNNAAAGVSRSGATCCNIDQGLQPAASATLTTLQALYGKYSYSLAPSNVALQPNAYQMQQRAVASQSCPPTRLPPAPVSGHFCTSIASLVPLAAAVNEYCYFNPLYPLGPVASATASMARPDCAVAYTAFALCQVALNNASMHTLTAAASQSTRARNATVTAASGTGLSSCCSSPGVPSTAAMLQLAYNTITGVGGQSPATPLPPC